MSPSILSRLAGIALLAVGSAGCGPERFLAADGGDARTIRAVHATRADGFWLVGEAGLVLRFDGDTFVDTSTDADPGPRVPGFYAVTDLSGAVYIVGDQGLVLRQEGVELTRDDNRSDQRLFAITRAGPRTLYAGGDEGALRTRSRDGDRWASEDIGAGDARITGAWASGPDAVAFSTDRGTIVERADGAWVSQTVVTETSTVPLPLFDVWSATVGADLLAVGLGGAAYRRRAQEDAWQLEPTGTQQDLYALYGSRPDDVFAVGARGTIVHFDGTGWRPVPSSTSKDLFGIDGTADGSLVVAGGAGGAVVVLRR